MSLLNEMRTMDHGSGQVLAALFLISPRFRRKVALEAMCEDCGLNPVLCPSSPEFCAGFEEA